MPAPFHRPAAPPLPEAHRAALRTIRDHAVSHASVPGSPGRTHYRYAAPEPGQWLTLPKLDVLALLRAELVRHGARTHDRGQWTELVGLTLAGERELRRSTKAAATKPTSATARPRKAKAPRPVAAAGPAPDVDLDDLVAELAGAGRSWVMPVPPLPLLSSNMRLHWAPEADRIGELRKTGKVLARKHRLPTLARAHLFYVVHPGPRTRDFDPGNWAPSAKALLDGLVDGGALPDDNARILTGPDPRPGARSATPGGRLTLVLTELVA
ncbi:hypothetical protein [Actinacidiphila sp. bgisy160]|uniref:hypothetical protein n=1 Tax=Actinacidiphila sp. bgisy160 TaxID=3413796 RepID=UPI003D72843C